MVPAQGVVVPARSCRRASVVLGRPRPPGRVRPPALAGPTDGPPASWPPTRAPGPRPPSLPSGPPPGLHRPGRAGGGCARCGCAGRVSVAVRGSRPRDRSRGRRFRSGRPRPAHPRHPRDNRRDELQELSGLRAPPGQHPGEHLLRAGRAFGGARASFLRPVGVGETRTRRAPRADGVLRAVVTWGAAAEVRPAETSPEARTRPLPRHPARQDRPRDAGDRHDRRRRRQLAHRSGRHPETSARPRARAQERARVPALLRFAPPHRFGLR